MFDTMVLTKALAGFCTALLIFLLGSWLADEVYLPYGPAPVAGFIDLGEDESAIDTAAAEEEVIDIAAMFAAADPGAGEALWRNCRACHVLVEGQNGVGPYLYGIVDRPINAVAGFNYSGALAALGETWSVEALNAFIENPRSTAPGTTMSYAGMRSVQDRMNLIAYMATFGG
jgi:cytochrome c